MPMWRIVEDPPGSGSFRVTEADASAVNLGDLVALEEVAVRTPSLSPEDQQVLHQALNAAARRVAPCFASGEVSLDAVAEARRILLQAVARHEDVDAWVESITTGPYGTRFRASAGSAAVLAPGDEAALRALCPGTTTGTSWPGAPRGSFPEPRPFYEGFGW